MRPFNLEEALAGEPVVLRNGTRAYVKYIMPEEYTGDYPLRGYMFDYTSPTDIREISWTMKGYGYNAPEDKTDIVGMWEEPQPRVTLTLPCPLKEPQEDMWYVENARVNRSLFTETNQNYSEEGLEAGMYFASKEDAQAWLDAMRNARI